MEKVYRYLCVYVFLELIQESLLPSSQCAFAPFFFFFLVVVEAVIVHKLAGH